MPPDDASKIQLWPEFEELRNWASIRQIFDAFPPPVHWLEERDLGGPIWIFRGHKQAGHELKPSIERDGGDRWSRERLALGEFRAKVRLHMDAASLPEGEEKLSWLALMQHVGIPTRLLDFTYSPYVALYFAIRNRTEAEQAEDAAVWALRVDAVQRKAERVSSDADHQEKDYQPRGGRVTFAPENFISVWNAMEQDQQFWRDAWAKALAPTGERREYYYRHGFAMVALPPVQNTRLSSQQGVFLFNGAERLSLGESLSRMMSDCKVPWCRRFRVPLGILPEVEHQLFNMNIHDLSLFPDVEGLAGFLRQKLRLYWKL